MRRIVTLCFLLTVLGLTAKAEEVYTLTYEGYPYRKTLCENPSYAAGTSVTLSIGQPVKDGVSLKAWKYDEVEYLPGATFVMPEADVVLVPVWQSTVAVENVQTETQILKYLRDGQLIIVRDGVEYNAQGGRLQ